MATKLLENVQPIVVHQNMKAFVEVGVILFLAKWKVTQWTQVFKKIAASSEKLCCYFWVIIVVSSFIDTI